MVDHISAERRSWLMSRVKGKNTTPEMRVRRMAHAMGLRFRLHRKDLPGKPDLVFPKYNVALFVHGCFWHRHEGCKKATMPKSRQQFWLAKFLRNQERDADVVACLESFGWRTELIWECETKNCKSLEAKIRTIFCTTGDEGDDER